MPKFNRDNRRDNRFDRGQGRPQMFEAVCGKCGNDCEVPFRPTGDRPVFCNNCFKSQGNAGFSKSKSESFGGRKNFGDKQMFSAVCAKCGNNCEVPFRPAPGKPVYCSQCFEKDGGRPARPSFNGNRGSDGSKAQFDMLNAKLDKILTALSANAFKGSDKGAEVKETKKSKPVLKKTKTVLKKATAKRKK